MLSPRSVRSTSKFGNLPLYCIPFAFKDVVDTKDMRSTANGDVNYEMDAPPFDSPVVARLREVGAIIYAKANAHEYNAGPGNPGGDAAAKTAFPSGVHAISAWSGQSCNPYDTEREPRGSSSGSGVSVSANLTMCAICEQTAGSCKGPASRNGLVNVLTHPSVNRRSGVGSSSTFTALIGIPEVTLPAGYNQVVYEPQFKLSADGTRYEDSAGTEPSMLPVPMPIAITFWGGPGDEATVFKVASTYESATTYRMSPPDFGPL